MINIISRSIIFKNISGPQKVVANLIKGLEKLNYPYVVNKRLDYCERLYIHDDRIALSKISKLDPKIKVLVGPNLYVVPRDIPKELDISRAIYLVPSEWNKRFWLHFGFDKCPMESWATGIDANEFAPSSKLKEFILIYWKQRFGWELDILKKTLEEKQLQYKVIHYDKGYKQEYFKDLLDKSRYVIWLGGQESQGIALQEALSENIPILVCDVKKVGDCSIDSGELNEKENDYSDATSAEYFDERCGIKIKDLNDFGDAVKKMENNLKNFQPRKYVLENLSLDGQAKKLLGFYEKYFGLAYQAGLEEKILNDGSWLNARWYYILYLKAKHSIKVLLVKSGIWKLLKHGNS